jgi:hypothetical protein
MFEILITIEALVESNEKGGRAYKITEKQVLENDDTFSSFMQISFEQDVRRALRVCVKTGNSREGPCSSRRPTCCHL